MAKSRADILNELATHVLRTLGHNPTIGQEHAARAMQLWASSEQPRPTLILRGYAGTGKTALLGSLAQVLASNNMPFFLLAPTGRAAKVMAHSAGVRASTIHSQIYRVANSGDGGPKLQLFPNKFKNALFIVDEASMLRSGYGDGEGFGDRDLLDDLLEHVFAAAGCKLLLIGDPAQLPPVGSDYSHALDVRFMREQAFTTAGRIELTEVVRQAEGSGILLNATDLREQMKKEEDLQPRFDLADFTDIQSITGVELEDDLSTAYGRLGADDVVVICRSNKNAYQYNMQVRVRIMGFEEELCAGDRLMVVKNDTFWDKRDGIPNLIANGELIEVLRVLGLEERYGLRYARVSIRIVDEIEPRELEILCMLDALTTEGPAMPRKRMNEVYNSAMEMAPGSSKRAKWQHLREDEHFNALQVKYAYAITCHKAQGGQWHTVFVDQGYVTEEMMDKNHLRWLYTAITRAKEKLFLVNFHPSTFGEVS